MASSRLNQALDEGAVRLPDGGNVAVIGAPAGYDLSPIDRDRVRITQGFKPDHDHWAALGYEVGPDVAPAEAAIVVLPRARKAALARISQAVSVVPAGAPVLIDGQKTDGIDSILKKLRGAVDLSPAFSKAHGKIAAFAACALPDDWAATTQKTEEGFVTSLGSFSADAVDPGSAALASALPPLKGRVADLGAGWGFLSAKALSNTPVTSVDLIEADFHSLEAARRNVQDERGHFHWADATTFSGDAPYDVVISNPPFHTSRKADPDLGRAFIRNAGKLVSRSGVFYMVANRHLPYEATLSEAFGTVEELNGPRAFKLIAARRPRTKR